MIKLFRIAMVAIGATFPMGAITGCSEGNTENHVEGQKMSTRTIEQVLQEHAGELISLAGVVGVAQGLDDGKPCIKVLVIEKTAELEQKIPKVLQGYPVVVEQTGEIRALPKNQHRTQ